MKSASLARMIARGWAAAYTLGVDRGARDRRRQEIDSEVWEQQHDRAEASGVLSRVLRGVPADLVWRSRQLREERRAELQSIAMSPASEAKVLLMGRATVVTLAALYLPMATGTLLLLWATVPVAVLLVRLDVRRGRRQRKDREPMTSSHVQKVRRISGVVLAASALSFVVGTVVDRWPSSAVHDRYWMLFVLPMMLGFMVGAGALVTLAWTYVPRRGSESP